VEDDAANVSGIKVKSKRSARQYMNRRGGFNRPLPAEKTGEKVARD
jgi:U4/U6.U5 tri-snRNP-associated protein 3